MDETNASYSSNDRLLSASFLDNSRNGARVNQVKARKTARRAKLIKILRVIQSVFSALLSISIAIFQGRVYWTFQATNNTPGTWPNFPNAVPTLLLFVVAVVALGFDSCMLVAYMWPASKPARWAVLIGGAAHTVISSAKTISYAISAVIMKTSFDYGNTSGQNTDLWSYTCSDQAAAVNDAIQGDSNCNSQYASWAFALFQLLLEIFSWFISTLAFFQTQEKLSAQAMEERFTAHSADVNGRLNEATPQFDLRMLS